MIFSLFYVVLCFHFLFTINSHYLAPCGSLLLLLSMFCVDLSFADIMSCAAELHYCCQQQNIWTALYFNADLQFTVIFKDNFLVGSVYVY